MMSNANQIFYIMFAPSANLRLLNHHEDILTTIIYDIMTTALTLIR